MKRRVALVAVVGLAGCGDDSAGEDCPVAVAGEVSFDPMAAPCQRLSSHGLFPDGPAAAPAAGVEPYDVASPLFSDYAYKRRYLWLPPGTAMQYAAEGPLELPVGAVLIKSFSVLSDLRDGAAGERMIETRLLVHRPDGWSGLVYLWDDAATEATLIKTGDVVPVEWIDAAGQARAIDYLVPDQNQCKNCHIVDDEDVLPIGPQAAHLNREIEVAGAAVNQLSHLADLGLLVGAPADPGDAPATVAWDDPTAGTLDQRVRAYLEINCAHCHNPRGPARTSGLDLRSAATDVFALGVCKPPVAAGGGSGGRQYSIVPGDPDASILVYRLESVEPDVRMPELLRQTVHAEGVALVREWITAMAGSCAPPG